MDETHIPGDSLPASVPTSRGESPSPVSKGMEFIGDAPRPVEMSGTSEESPSSQSTVIDELEFSLGQVSSNPRFLIRLILVTSTPGLAHIWLVMSIVFLTVDVAYRCRIRDLESSDFNAEEQLNLTYLATSDDMCHVVDINYKAMIALTYDEAARTIQEARKKPDQEGFVPCRDFIFEDKDRSIVSTFWLVCERRVLLYEFQITAFVGMAIGGPFSGCFSDQYGRKVVFIASIIVSVVMFPLPSIITDFWSLLISHFLCGIANTGAIFTGFTLLMEWVRGYERTTMGLLFHVPTGLGLIWAALLSYCIPEWRYFQMAISIPAVLLAINCFFVPESPRWLISQGLREEAWRVIQSVDSTLRPSEGDPTKPPLKPEELSKTCFHYCRSFYKHREIRLRLLICVCGWLFAIMLYYYLLLGSAAFRPGLMFLFVGACGVVDIVSYAVSMLLMKGSFVCVTGFKPIVTVLLCSSGALVVGLSLMPFSVTSLVFILALMVRMSISSATAMIMIQSIQLFPTKCRNNAMGICAFFAYFLGIVIPFVIMLHIKIHVIVASFVYWAGAAICGCILLFLPKSYGDADLIDTLDEVDEEVANRYRVECRNFNRCP